MKKILIADDHSVTRKGITQILMDEFTEVEFGEASNAVEIFSKLKEKKWDVLILDIHMPGKSGLDVLKQLKDEKATIPVLVLSMYSEEQIAMEALELGAFGYISKDNADTELIKAIRQTFNGKKYLTPSIAELLDTQIKTPSGKTLHELLS